MARFEVQGVGIQTGRSRRRVYQASTVEAAREKALADGMQPDEMTELPEEPATERQIEFAKELGLEFPDGIGKESMSAMISTALDRDEPAALRYRQFARVYGVEPHPHHGKKIVFDLIFSALSARGREQELASWFTFRVYRSLKQGADNTAIDTPDHPTITAIGAELAEDPGVIKSIRNYESGRDLIWFGSFTGRDGRVIEGASNRTKAYKQATEKLREHGEGDRAPPFRPPKDSEPEPERPARPRARTIPQRKKSGITLVDVLMVAPVLLILVFIVSRW